MQAAPEINKKLNSLKFEGAVKYRDIRQQLQRVLRPWAVRVRLFLDESIDDETFACSGCFDTTAEKRPIEVILHFNHHLNDFSFTDRSFKDFKFLVSQVLQHELIHQYQYTQRPTAARQSCLYFDIKAGVKSDKEHMDYLAELDEIDCYAHDIAMEIREFYPRLQPQQVLANINSRRKLWSWRYYRSTFKHSPDWSEVHNRLLKKVYQWLPYTH
jgi:hypothetical protein